MSLKRVLTHSLTAIALSFFFAGVSRAQITDNFDSGMLGPDLDLTFNNGETDNIVFANGRILFGSTVGGDGGRAFVGTIQDDFIGTDFTANVDITIADTGGDNAFFGLGTGQQSRFGVPGQGPSLFYGFNETGGVFGADANDGAGPTGGQSLGSLPGAGDYTLQLDYVAATQVISLSATGIDDAGNITAITLDDTTLDGSNNSFGTNNARIFFGGDDGTSFDNFSVVTTAAVPEPSSIALFGAGAIGMLLRRRRF